MGNKHSEPTQQQINGSETKDKAQYENEPTKTQYEKPAVMKIPKINMFVKAQSKI